MAFNSTTVNKTGKQYLYTGRGPLDPKALVNTYSQLLDASTWTEGTSIIAYNGMITAVWLDPDTSKNGIYFLHDPQITSKWQSPNVEDSANWHKLGELDNLPGLTDQLKTIEENIAEAQSNIEDLQKSATIVEDCKASFPEIGQVGKLYVATEEAMTFIWHDGDYLPVGDGGDNDKIQIISGGGPTA